MQFKNKLTTFKDSLAYLDSLNPLGIKLGLERVQKILSKLGSPQDTFPSVIVAGTNGKGSTASMLSSILREGGHTVGLYTSPHLTHFCERIQINGVVIPDKRLLALIQKLDKFCSTHNLNNTLTYFEFVTILCFLYFSEESVDIAVLEVGLGGRLDAVNVVTPIAASITEIDLDHQLFLGESITEIASEKGGIIKRNATVVLTSQKPEVVQTISDICLEMDASLLRFGKDFNATKSKGTKQSQFLDFSSNQQILKELSLTLQGDHQIQNAANAIQTALIINKAGIMVKDSHIQNGLKKTTLPCRFEILQGPPDTVLDTAHNPSAIETLVCTLRQFYPDGKLIFIIGIMKDKYIESIFRIIGSEAMFVILIRAKSRRAADPCSLKKIAEKYCKQTLVARDIHHALSTAYKKAGENDVICITGSFFVVGEARQQVLKMRRELSRNRTIIKSNE